MSFLSIGLDAGGETRATRLPRGAPPPLDSSTGSSSSTRRPAVRRVAWRVAQFAVPALFVGAAVVGVMGLRGAGYRMIAVHGASMEGAIPAGSVVVAEWRASRDVRLGDAIVIQEESEGQLLAPKLHRVVSIHEDEGSVVVQTKGDANDTPDAGEYVLGDRVLVARYDVPYLGFIAGYLMTPLGWLAAIVLPLLTVALLMVYSIWRPSRDAGPPGPA